MSNIIVNPKNYTGRELETIFFRPLLSGPSAESLGIRVLYNMPMPTVVQMWDHSTNVLAPFDKNSAWSGRQQERPLPEDHPHGPREGRERLFGERLLLDHLRAHSPIAAT